jgi:hypothetical protein
MMMDWQTKRCPFSLLFLPEGSSALSLMVYIFSELPVYSSTPKQLMLRSM